MKQRMLWLLMAMLVLLCGCQNKVGEDVKAEELYLLAFEQTNGNVDVTVDADISVGMGILSVNVGMQINGKMQITEEEQLRMAASLALTMEEEVQALSFVLYDDACYLDYDGSKVMIAKEDMEAYGVDTSMMDLSAYMGQKPTAEQIKELDLTLETTEEGYVVRTDKFIMPEDSMAALGELGSLGELQVKQEMFFNKDQLFTGQKLSFTGDVKMGEAEDSEGAGLTVGVEMVLDVTINNPGKPVTVELPRDADSYTNLIADDEDDENDNGQGNSQAGDPDDSLVLFEKVGNYLYDRYIAKDGYELWIPAYWEASADYEDMLLLLQAPHTGTTGASINLVVTDGTDVDLFAQSQNMDEVYGALEQAFGVKPNIITEGEIISLNWEDALLMEYTIRVEGMELAFQQVMVKFGDELATLTGTIITGSEEEEDFDLLFSLVAESLWKSESAREGEYAHRYFENENLQTWVPDEWEAVVGSSTKPISMAAPDYADTGVCINFMKTANTANMDTDALLAATDSIFATLREQYDSVTVLNEGEAVQEYDSVLYEYKATLNGQEIYVANYVFVMDGWLVDVIGECKPGNEEALWDALDEVATSAWITE